MGHVHLPNVSSVISDELAAPQRMISVRLLGHACLRAGDALLKGPPAQRHRIALLALIVASWPHPIARERAMTLLWPERDQANARRLLNLAVHVLRSALGVEAIVSTGEGLLFDPARLRCDLHELRTAIAADDAERIVQLYAGVFLDGFHLDDSTEFVYWLDERRAELTHAYVGALRAFARVQERSNDLHGLVSTCRRLVAAEPYSGANALTLMRALDAAGDRAAAIRHSADHVERVRADLELDADPGVLAFADQLRNRAARPRSPLVPTPPVFDRSVAVLPFLLLGAGKENETFADGVTEDVIAHLCKIRALRVISRTSVQPFRERRQSAAEIGARLGVTALLDGSVRRDGDRVRIVATLIDVANEHHLWTETYDRDLTDIFAVQTEVALHIASALRVELTRDERVRVHHGPTKDLRAYARYLEGRRWFVTFAPPAIERAIDYFRRAIASDPSFAQAYSSLAAAHVELAEHGAMAPDVAYPTAREAARMAVSLDPELGDAHCTLGHVKAVFEFDWAGAERDFTRAIRLNPSGADTYDLYGRMCAALGRYDDAIALQLHARELDPLAHRVDHATTLMRAGRYDEARRLAADAVELDPGNARARATLGWVYFLSGEKSEGLMELARAVQESQADTMWLAQLGQAHGLVGDAVRAREILNVLLVRSAREYVSPYHLAYVYTGLGDLERALDCLERAVTERAGGAYGIKGSLLLAPLQRHPRFRAVLAKMNLD
jgi:TolB-like protein/DNA-binding SARP family transcriptional activator/Flp pilus assembly protein TadD